MIEIVKGAVTQMRDYVTRKSTSTPWWVLVTFLMSYIVSTVLFIYMALDGDPARFATMADVYKYICGSTVAAFAAYASGGIAKIKAQNGVKKNPESTH